jgi:hypothetical protein
MDEPEHAVQCQGDHAGNRYRTAVTDINGELRIIQ